jgi:CelD/BcsL family acetyltransferase involved in cellulose biosynthesis
VKVEILERLEAVGATAWRDLHAATRLRSPFLTFTWQREWVRAFASSRRLELRSVKDDTGGLIAVLPLHEAEPGVMRLIGGVDVSDYLDLIAVAGREEDAWNALLQSRTQESAVWDLHVVPAASPTVTTLPGLAGAAGLTVTVAQEERCPVLSLPRSWDQYLERLPSKHRHEMQRKIRRFQRELPEARVTCLERPDEIETRFGDFLDLHRRSLVGKARFMDPRMEGFFHRAIIAMAGDGAVRLWFLDLPSGPIASFICLDWDGTVGLYNSGFHPGSAALSPGLVLLANLIEDAILRGKRTFDFLRGEERYKYEFGPVAQDVFSVRLESSPGGPSA